MNGMHYQSTLVIDAISVQYQHKPILDGLSLTVARDEIMGLLGKSGGGKTTLLKALSGLLPLKQGTILLDGKSVASKHDALPPNKRQIGVIFQDFALFPHMNVLDNVCFGMKRDKQDGDEGAHVLLTTVNMQDYLSAYPHELSGGQQQRVAIARALAAKPKLLLLDEPFSNVDYHLRRQLMIDIRSILKQTGIAAILVTHDTEEAFTFADKLAFMEDGKIVQTGTADDLYHYPVSMALANAMGASNWLDAVVTDSLSTLVAGLGKIMATEPHRFAHGSSVRQCIRPDKLMFQLDLAGKGNIIDRVFAGNSYLYTVAVDDLNLLIQQPPDESFKIGAQVTISVKAHQLLLFNQE